AVDEAEHVLGYARSILRDDVRELTEFFVLPNMQGGGVGRELLGRAFPAEGAHHRTIVATLELPALVRYLKTGLVAQALLGYFSRAPEVVEIETDLEMVAIAGPAAPSAEAAPSSADEVGIDAALEAIGAIDRAILGHRRDADHRWLLGDRTGVLARRDDRVVGYAYIGGGAGPMAALEARDMPAILATAESAAARAGRSAIGCFVPMVNGAAIGHLLGRGYRLDPFLATFFSDGHPPRFESYVLTSPPFFV
ncbi:MAG TPA: GNAT family N-acetyltransferase, partial [Candidatus Saccharimonadia bacterium]|nr:GNAT family N-acetyltransferase [Candidatus Saccharimonadia bacterium]